jgi:hypothetical protein
LRYQVRFYAYAAMLTSEYPRGLFGDRTDPVHTDIEAAAPLPAQPRISKLALSRSARRLVTLFIAVGVLLQVGVLTTAIVTSSRTDDSLDQLVSAHTRLEGEVQQFQTTAQSCAVAGGLDCIHQAHRKMADGFVAFDRELRDIAFPPGSESTAIALDGDATQIVRSLRELATVTTLPEFQSATVTLQRELNKFDADYRDLVESLTAV